MSMKFSFICPSPAPEAKGKIEAPWPPLGVLYCAGMLMNAGFEVSILDQATRGLSSEQVLKWVKRENPDILGFSVLITSYREALNLARRAKEDNPNLLTVFGNYHATFNAERILKKYPFVDAVVRGEGEHVVPELAGCMKKKRNFKEIDSLTFRNEGHVVSTPDAPLIGNIESLPIPDRDLIDAEYTSEIFGIKVATRKFTSMISSRGCPFRCSFCGCRKFARGVWRPRSVENIMKELQLLYSKGFRQFLFVDDNFTLNLRRIQKLCQEIRKEKMDIEWFCDSRVDNCKYEVFRDMVKAGCRLLYFGVESANQRILNYYNKGITPEQTRRAVGWAKKAGIDVIVGSFIVGAPDETRKEVETTLKFAYELPIDVPQLNILSAFPGTDSWNDLVQKGFIDEEKYWEQGVYVSQISPHAVPFEEIQRMTYDYFKTFYLRPAKLIDEVLKTFKSRYRMTAFLSNLVRAGEIRDTVRRETKLEPIKASS
ncbi:MAG TPA: radical SAM protein [Candidatus Bathyarchaeia archaeon]|nr:radical SAM protein [Candidatus Bathyarchaeia archaeon]